MKRALRVLCIVLALCAALCVTALAADYEDIALELSAVGVFKGTGSGFDLDRAPTRAEAAIMLVRLYGAEEQATADFSAGTIAHPFPDVPDYAAPHVAWLYTNGLTKGLPDGTFGANDICNAQSYATFLLRSLGWKDDVDFTYAQAFEAAQAAGFYDPQVFPGDFLRDDLAAMTYQALACDVKAGDTWLLAQLIDSGAVNAEAADPMTEKMTLYRAVQTAQPAAEGEAIAMDLGLDYAIRYDAPGLEDLTVEASTAGQFAFKGEGEDFQAVYELAISTEGVVVGTGLWIRDGWTYMSMDMSGIPLMQVKYPTNDEDITSLPTTDSMGSVSMAELAAVKSITAEKQGKNTVYTIVYNGNAAVLTEAAAEAFYDNAPEGTVLNGMTFDNVVMTITLDKDGMATDHEVVYAATADTLVTLEDGTQVSLKMVLDYIMTIDITARGKSVKIAFPDLSAFQEIDPSMLED